MSRESMAAALRKERAGRAAIPASPAKEAGDSPDRPPSRRGKKALVCYVDPAVARQIKILGAQEDKSLQALLVEAVNGLLAQRGMLPIA